MSSPPSHWNYSPFDGGNFRIHGSTIFFMVLFFSIVFIAVMLFLYSRRNHFLLSPPLPSSADDSPDRSAHPPTPTPRGLDASAINSLPTVLCKGNGNDRSECCICLGIFTDGEKVRVLPHCYHRFHSECVDKWLKTQSSCPLCRDCLRVDSPV